MAPETAPRGEPGPVTVTAACNCDASGDPPTGHRPWCGTEPDDEPCLCDTPFTCLARHQGCYICRPDDPTASPEGCAACDARSDAYHALEAGRNGT